MSKITLTDLAIQKLKWNGRYVTYFDTILPSFGVRVGKKDKTFVVVRGRERIATTIGHYGDVTLQGARMKALQIIEQGATPPRKTLLGAKMGFLRDCSRRLKPDTVKQYESYLNQLDIDLTQLSKPYIAEKLSILEGKPWAQNYAYATVRAFLNWCLDNEYIDTHPLIRGKPPNKTRSRDRVLSDEEMARIWRCTENNTYGSILRLLILTGQRRMEVRNLKPEGVQDGLITFRTKGDKVNIIPVTPLMKPELARLPYTFNDWSGCKARFDNNCGVDFRHHDLRRTMATTMARLGISHVTIERILGHSLHGVQWTYNRYAYLTEMKTALLTYEQHIRKITSPMGSTTGRSYGSHSGACYETTDEAPTEREGGLQP